jgi:hypothetical protein
MSKQIFERKASAVRLACAVLALACCCTQSAAAPAEDNVIGAFETFCLDNLNVPDRAVRLIDALGLAEIPEPDRAILMTDHPERAWQASEKTKSISSSFLTKVCVPLHRQLQTEVWCCNYLRNSLGIALCRPSVLDPKPNQYSP